MPYHLLTGSTGLLGTYLLRDLLVAGQQVAVVVRSSVTESAQQRIEDILSRWEQTLGYALPRPPVLEGDICRPDLGLEAADIDWVAKHCVSALHNAASLSFQVNERSGEPYRSNVDGTRNVLELCRKTGIRRFHHVSTAYVCGLRTGRVCEDELDVGQTSGNDYEKSKIQAETLVREADFLAPPTIYRPAIIIGDSVTGYTTTYHGFYTPLKIGQAIIDRIHLNEIQGAPLMAALGLDGRERKSLVPVDWVARAISYLYCQPAHHGRTYHITPANPVSVATICEVAEQAMNEYACDSSRADTDAPDLEELQETFTDQMGVYRAYWRDDPEFAHTNYAQAAPHLPCPDVDAAMLLRTSRYALRTNFGWPRPPAVRPEFDVRQYLQDVLAQTRGNAASLPTVEATRLRVGLQVNGPGGGQWTLAVAQNGAPVAFEPGCDDVPLLYLNSWTFQQCVRRELTVEDAAAQGFLVLETRDTSRETLLDILCAVTTATAAEATNDTARTARPKDKPVAAAGVK